MTSDRDISLWRKKTDSKVALLVQGNPYRAKIV